MQDKRQSSSSQYVNHAFQAEIHAQPSDDATSTVVTSGDHATKTKRAPFQRQESLSSTAANALISVASVTTNAPSPKIPQKSQRNREKATTPAISSDSDEHSGYVSDLADFWREYKRSRKYEHPFGKKADLLGQILCGEREESSENQTDSPAKIIIWMIFFCFMVGVAGAIILGAETAIRSIPRNVTLTTPGPGT